MCNVLLVVDHCQSWPCQNSATCVNSVVGFTCACVVGYTGLNCELGTKNATLFKCFCAVYLQTTLMIKSFKVMRLQL
jgi:hypothetical protein